MPNYKNTFRNPEFREETIVDEDNAVVGTIRIKPVSILWKPKNGRKFYKVSLQDFATWIVSNGKEVTK